MIGNKNFVARSETKSGGGVGDSVAFADPPAVIHASAGGILLAITDVEISVGIGVMHIKIVPDGITRSAHIDGATSSTLGVGARENGEAIYTSVTPAATLKIAGPSESTIGEAVRLKLSGGGGGGDGFVPTPIAGVVANENIFKIAE